MKLIGHIVKKDLRRFWVGFVILAGIVALKFFLADAVFHLDMPPRDWNSRLERYQGFLLAAQVLLSFALAVGLVQEDSVPDAGALCQTLPLTRSQLLGAKMLSILLVCVLPVVLTLSAGWVLLGLPSAQLGWPLTAFAGTQLGLGLVALAFGSLTKNAGHLLFWLLGVILAIAIPAMILEPMLRRTLLVTPGTRLTHIVLVHSVWIIAALAVVLNQYLGRSRKRSIVFVAAGVLLVFYFIETERTRLSLDLASTHFPAQREMDAQISRLRVNILQADVAFPQPDADDPTIIALLRVSVEQPNRGLFISPRGFYTNWPDISPLFIAKLYSPRENYLKAVAEHELALPSDPAANHIEFGAETRLFMNRRFFNLGKAAPYQGQIDLDVYETSVGGFLTLTKGASLRSTIGTARILGVNFDGSAIHVDLEGRFSAMGVDPGWFPGLEALGDGMARYMFALVNRKTKTVLTPSRTNSVTLSSYAYGADLGHAQLAYSLPKAEIGAGGLADWDLVEFSSGDRHRSIRSFQENVSFQEVPAINHDPAWQQ